MDVNSILSKAHVYVKQGEYIKAISCYDRFCILNEDLSHIVNLNKKYCLARLNNIQQKELKEYGIKSGDSIANIFYDMFGIEKIYVVSLKREYGRRARFLREMSKFGVTVEVMFGEDGKESDRSSFLLTKYKSRRHGICFSTRHIDRNKIKKWKQELGLEVFAYLLSQQRVFEDAIRHKYKRILVFDDDVFFHSNAENMLKIIATAILDDFKIIALGASEYTDTSLNEFDLYKISGYSKIAYHPVPGNTCGSFAVIYDQSIYKELLDSIKECDGPYDNCALGEIYLKYKDQCFVANPAICIPDVAHSNIRECRNQIEHSLRMNWEVKRYDEFMKPFHIGIIFLSVSKEKIKSFFKEEESPYNFINLYVYRDGDVERIEINKNILESQSDIEACLTYDDIFLHNICKKIIDRYDLVMLIPQHVEINNQMIDIVTCEALAAYNHLHEQSGIHNGIFYMINVNSLFI